MYKKTIILLVVAVFVGLTAAPVMAGGACCYEDGSCGQAYAVDCQLDGGEYKGAGTEC